MSEMRKELAADRAESILMSHCWGIRIITTMREGEKARQKPGQGGLTA